MKILLIILLVLFVILFFPVGLRMVYRDKAKLHLIVFLIPIKINLEKKDEQKEPGRLKKLFGKLKKKKAASATEEKSDKKNALGTLAKDRGVLGALEYLINIAKIAGGAFGGILRGVILAKFDVYMRVGGNDAAAAATNFGTMCAFVYPLLAAILNRLLVYRKRFDFAPDFCSGNTVFYINTLALVFPGLVLWQLLKAFVRLVAGIIRERVEENLESASGSQQSNA